MLQMMFIVAEGTAVISLLAASHLQARSAVGFSNNCLEQA
jgi:hypothetical protein